MEELTGTIVLFISNCLNTYDMLTVGSWAKNYISGYPQPSETQTVEDLRRRNYIGLYQPVTEEEIVKLSKDSYRKLCIFDWIGDYPDPEFYDPQFLTYPHDGANILVAKLSKKEYREFVSQYTVLPKVRSAVEHVGLYKERVKLRSE